MPKQKFNYGGLEVELEVPEVGHYGIVFGLPSGHGNKEALQGFSKSYSSFFVGADGYPTEAKFPSSTTILVDENMEHERVYLVMRQNMHFHLSRLMCQFGDMMNDQYHHGPECGRNGVCDDPEEYFNKYVKDWHTPSEVQAGEGTPDKCFIGAANTQHVSSVGCLKMKHLKDKHLAPIHSPNTPLEDILESDDFVTGEFHFFFDRKDFGSTDVTFAPYLNYCMEAGFRASEAGYDDSDLSIGLEEYMNLREKGDLFVFTGEGYKDAFASENNEGEQNG